MFRKLFAIAILLVYLPAVAGVGFSTHYCWGEAKETKVFSVSKQSCCCSENNEAEEEKGCCSDEIKFVKLENDHQSSHFRLSFKPANQDLFVPPVTYFNESPVRAEGTVFIPHFSPPPLGCKKNILFCCYRI